MLGRRPAMDPSFGWIEGPTMATALSRDRNRHRAYDRARDANSQRTLRVRSAGLRTSPVQWPHGPPPAPTPHHRRSAEWHGPARLVARRHRVGRHAGRRRAPAGRCGTGASRLRPRAPRPARPPRALMRLLLAEDEPRLAAAIAKGLRGHGAAVDVAADGAAALFHARVHPYDVLLLDRDLPEVHGDRVCRTLRDEQPGLKILMLTAARSTDELVGGLALGADDYLGKPFRFAELVARVHALSPRAGTARPPVLKHADVELDPARRTATRGGEDLGLS